MSFIKTISDVFEHASYKCPVNNCFEWACIIHVKRFTSYLKLLKLLIMGFINNLKSKLQKTFTEATLFQWCSVETGWRFMGKNYST